ncbi:MAG: hypothetical protein J1E83_11825 [Lachnospiraceae bacterium]|nr:hypothetical protein [Lachnospiraceae bacterium]
MIQYDENIGIQFNWEENFAIEVKNEGGEVIISANSEGLLSLAKHLLTLAQNEVPVGAHIHLDEYNSLEEGSIGLIIEKRN